MRSLIFISLIVLVLPLALGEISVQLPQDSANIGDTIAVDASAVSDASVSGFMRFTAVCGKFSLPYYLAPVDLLAGFRTQVDAPPLKISSSMKGQCAIKVELLNDESDAVDSGLSSSFSVTDGLRVILLTENLSVLPGDGKKIEGIVRGAGDKTLNADIEFWLDDASVKTATFNGKFIIPITIPGDSKSGAHPIKILAIDKEMNQGSVDGEIIVVAVPTYLEIELSPDQQDPGMNITYTITLKDQARDIIADSSDIGLRSSEGTSLFKAESGSGDAGSYVLSQYLAPGQYTLEANYKDLHSSKSFRVNVVEDVRVFADGSEIVVENAGNVPYTQEAMIVVENEGKKRAISKEFDLAPGQSERVLLSKELPSGTYDVEIPAGMRLSSFDNSSNGLLAQGVLIEDQRSSIKKIGSGLGSMTGAVIGADGALTGSGWHAPLLLIGVVLLIGLYFSRGIWAPFVLGRR